MTVDGRQKTNKKLSENSERPLVVIPNLIGNLIKTIGSDVIDSGSKPE